MVYNMLLFMGVRVCWNIDHRNTAAEATVAAAVAAAAVPHRLALAAGAAQ